MLRFYFKAELNPGAEARFEHHGTKCQEAALFSAKITFIPGK